jgi:N-methylhydantoinase A
MGYRISVDVGGTFTDLVIAETEGNVLLGRYKSPTTPEDRSLGVLNCLKLTSEDLNISLQNLLENTTVIYHGSTTATNAVLEGGGAKCGLICTKGTKYILWRGEGRRKNMFNYKVPSRTPLIRPYLCLEVTERINSEGEVVLPLNEDEVRAAVRQLKDWNVETIAVSTLWSIVNPVHERRIGEIIEKEWPGVYYCISSDIQPIIREYHRTSCVVFNAMLQPIVTHYLNRLQSVLADNGFNGELLIVVSSGGVVPIEEVAKKPVFMLFSGPAMGPFAGLFYARQDKRGSCITIDMGGTSFDVSTVIDGHITSTREGRILDYPTGVSSIEILTLGAGGGSIAWVDSAGRIGVGPQSAEAVPGPACYMRGGTEPTVTDAYVTLGYIIPEHFLGGRMKIDPELSKKVIKERVADPLELSVEEAAFGICQVVNGNMIGGILDMTVRRGIDPREFVIITGGGATAIPVAQLAKELGVGRVIIPKETSVLCAFGAINAPIALSSVASKYTNSGSFDYEGVNKLLEELEEKGKAFLDSLGTPPEKREEGYYCAVRYPLQITELEIALSDKRVLPEAVSKLVQDFHDASLARYKTNDPTSPVEAVMWRHVARSVTPGIELAKQIYGGEDPSGARLGKQLSYFDKEEGFIETRYYDGDKLVNGMIVTGPAIVVLPDTTIVVPPRFKITTQEAGYYVMEAPVS